MIEGCLSPLPGIFFYTPSLPGTYFEVERFRACALQLPGIDVLGLSLPAAGHADTIKKIPFLVKTKVKVAQMNWRTKMTNNVVIDSLYNIQNKQSILSQ